MQRIKCRASATSYHRQHQDIPDRTIIKQRSLKDVSGPRRLSVLELDRFSCLGVMQTVFCGDVSLWALSSFSFENSKQITSMKGALGCAREVDKLPHLPWFARADPQSKGVTIRGGVTDVAAIVIESHGVTHFICRYHAHVVSASQHILVSLIPPPVKRFSIQWVLHIPALSPPGTSETTFTDVQDSAGNLSLGTLRCCIV